MPHDTFINDEGQELGFLRGHTTPMGIGNVGLPGVIFKRKFRWKFKIDVLGPRTHKIPEHFVKTAARPNLDIEEVQVDFLNSTTWFPGKARWQQMTVTYHDVDDNLMAPLYEWMVDIYDFQDHLGKRQTEKEGWTGTGTLTLYDGCGGKLETWTLFNMFPTSINFGDLDYSNSEISTVDLSLRYSEVTYDTHCKMRKPRGLCVGCV